MSLVLDASVTLAWILEETLSETAMRAGQIAAAGPVHAPAIWPFEVANVLLTQARRGRVGAEDLALALQHVAGLAVVIDLADAGLACGPLATLALQHGLTAYDAAYLELALRRDLPLATLDSRLAEVAVSAGARLA